MNLAPFDDRLRITPLDSQETRARLLRICILGVAVALLIGMFVATILVAEAAETDEAPLSPEAAEVIPQQFPPPAAPAGSSGDQWPWAIVAGVLVILAGGSYVAGRRSASA